MGRSVDLRARAIHALGIANDRLHASNPNALGTSCKASSEAPGSPAVGSLVTFLAQAPRQVAGHSGPQPGAAAGNTSDV